MQTLKIFTGSSEIVPLFKTVSRPEIGFQNFRKRKLSNKTVSQTVSRAYVVERFGTLFCHEWGVLEVSWALVDTVLIRKIRSTIWEWSQSLQGSRNNEKKGNTLNETSKNVLGRFGILFCHEWGVLEVSEALDDTGLSAKMGSTIWEWSQSLQGSGNNKKKRNT